MTQPSSTSSDGLVGRQRLLAVILGGVVLLLMGMATGLRPDARGYGTHEQLGLPPCTCTTLVGWRCPACGMTTAWTYLVRGQVAAAAQANLAGTLLGLLGLAAVPWLWASAWRGCWVGLAPNTAWAAWAAMAFVAITLVDWVFHLHL